MNREDPRQLDREVLTRIATSPVRELTYIQTARLKLEAKTCLEELEAVEANLKRERISHRKSLDTIYRMAIERENLKAETERLREALGEACELAEEGIDYTDSYFVEKYRMRERLKDARRALGEEAT